MRTFELAADRNDCLAGEDKLQNIPLTLVGTEFLDNFQIEECISDGQLAWVYKARTRKDSFLAIKLAKPQELVSHTGDSPLESQSLAIGEGGVFKVRPDAKLALSEQHSILRDFAFVGLYNKIDRDDWYGYLMEYIENDSLREVMRKEPAKPILKALIHLCETMILSKPFDINHGDLNPSNILVENDDVALLDPGRFGLMNCIEGRELQCVITSPGYYPFLKPDDLFAMGVIFWEAVCKQHPFAPAQSKEKSNQVGDSIKKLVAKQENVGNYFLSPLLQLIRPAEFLPGLNPGLEEILLKGLRLRLDSSGKLETAPGFEDFAQWHLALEELQASGIEFPF